MDAGDHGPQAAEAQARWGHTDAYRESAKRTQSYSKADWDRIKAETEAIERGFAEAMTGGELAESARAMDLAERARLQIDGSFYPCSHAMHVKLAEMYTADARFRAHYDDRAEGLAQYVANAIRANGARRSDEVPLRPSQGLS
jgi:hypothetical protein